MSLVERFNGMKALVLGDVMIDAYSKGIVERMSPEAPVPIVALNKHFDRLGGATNVAINLQALGATATVCSVVGTDSQGDRLLQLMKENLLNTDGIVRSNQRMTTVKHRIFNGDQQLLRVDEEDTFDLLPSEYDTLIKRIENRIQQERYDVIILQDYNKGVLCQNLIDRILDLGRDNHIPVAVDPKKKNFFAYKGVALFKPNAKELCEGLGIHAETLTELRQAAMQLLERLQCQHLMVTLSERGAMILSKNDKGPVQQEPAFHHVAACRRTITDVSGAGDTVLSVAALCTALNCDPKTTVTLSNIAGGLVCEESGVVPIDKNKFLEEVNRLCHD